MRSIHTLCAFVLFIVLGGCQIGGGVNYKVLSEREDRLFVQLDNGLVIFAQKMDAPVVTVQSYVKTGSIYEQEFNGLGLSHFLEHLVAGGSTTTRTEEQSNAILGRIGARTNAFTSLDTVGYYINTSADHAATAVDLLSDWMQHSVIGEAEFDRERQVIAREFAMGRGEPGRIFWKLTQLVRFPPDHPARHPTIGYEDEFVAVTRDQVYDFYRRMYVPNNIAFVVVGDIEPQQIVDQVAKLWSAAEPRDLPQIVLPEERPITEPRRIEGHADIDRPRLRLAWSGTDHATPEDYALDLLGRILGDGELSRLVRTVRDELGLVTSIDAGNWSYHWGQGTFFIDAMPERGRLDEAGPAILEVIRRLAEEGVSGQELQRAKNKTVAETAYAAQTAEDMAGRLARDFFETGDPDYLHHYAQAIQQVTAAQVQAAARKFLRPERAITVRLLPAETPEPLIEKRPAESPPGLVLAEGPDTRVIDLDNKRLIDAMLDLQALVHEVRPPDVEPMRMHRLSNGMRIIVQRNTRLPVVAMQWYHLGGLLSDEPGREGVANAMANMLLKGAADRSGEEIAEVLEDIGAQMNSDAGNSTLLVTAQSLSKDWPQVMQIMSDVIRRPTFPADEWALMQPRLLAAIDSIDDLWHFELRNGFRSSYFGAHPWSQPTIGRRAVVEALTPEVLHEFHAQHIGAEDAVLAIVGDIDRQEALDRVEELFGDIPVRAAKPRVLADRTPFRPGWVYLPTSKPTPAVMIGYGPGMKIDNPDYPAVRVMTSVLSSFPVGWLDRALRGEGEGLAYAVGAGIFTGAEPGYWSVLFNTQNETLVPAIETALAVVERIRTQTVDELTLTRARQAVLVGEAFGRQSFSQIAASSALDELYGLGYDHAEEAIEKIRAVNAADVRQAAERYIRAPLGVILSNEEPDRSALPPLRGLSRTQRD